MTALPGCPSNPLGIIGRTRGWGLRFKNVEMLFAQAVSINAKPFAPESTRAERVIPYLFFDKVYGTCRHSAGQTQGRRCSGNQGGCRHRALASLLALSSCDSL